MSRSLRAAFVVWVGCSLGSASAALAQDRAQPGPLIGFTGEWAAQVHEDAPYRGPGGFLGDYTGLPINAAARQMAESWDADILWQPERGTQAWPAQYAMRGEGPNIRISDIRDPVTDALIALKIVGIFRRSDRTIWLDDRAHAQDRPDRGARRQTRRHFRWRPCACSLSPLSLRTR